MHKNLHWKTTARYILVAFIVRYVSCNGQVAEGNIQAITVVNDEGNKENIIKTDEGSVRNEHTMGTEDMKVFQPTSEWQVIQDGQAIPAGLHVRMNLATGRKEAKLISEKDNKKTGPKFQNGTPYTKKELKELLQNLPADNAAGETFFITDEDRDRVRKQFRSMEEIKEDLSKIELNIKTDLQVLKSNIAALTNKTATKNDRFVALESIEYLLHQIDNAKDFHTLNGYQIVIKAVNDTDIDIKSIALRAIGAAVQSNLEVQRILLDLGVLPIILSSIDANAESSVRRKALFALSSLLRHFPPAQLTFIHLGGIGIMTKLFHEDGAENLRIRALTIIVDLLKENHTNYQAEDNISITASILDEVLEHKWCKFIPALLQTTDNDIIEKTLEAMNTMIQYCKQHFIKDHIASKMKALEKIWRKLVAEDEEENSFYFNLIDLSEQLQKHLSSSHM